MAFTIYVDLDGTLIDHCDVPKPHVINFLKKQHEKGAKIYLWTQAGEDQAEYYAKKLKIEHLFTAFLEKPNICIDDLPIEAPFIHKTFHPNELICD